MAKKDKKEELTETRGVFMISIAAELAGMHPQTLRVYEARGLIKPTRSPKQTRLYSQADVDRLRRIQRLRTQEGLNLAGIELMLEMEARLERMRAEVARMRERLSSPGAEIVPYGAYDSELAPAEAEEPVKIPIEKKKGGKRNAGR